MGIDVEWQDENGESIQRIIDPDDELSDIVIHATSFSKYELIKYIDPFGDTLFNQNQIPVLIKEFEKLLKEKKQESKLGGMLKLIKSSKGKTHTYIRFIGD